ncbi:MAG: sulfotransferase family 2 domain-containing protein [Planctomycetia bacterium]
MRWTRAAADRRYVVLVRDPVSRFVSAFNWRCHLLENELLPAARTQDPIARLRHRTEREFLAHFEDVNAFAERLVQTGEHEVSALATLMQLVGHVPQGFVWYLDDLLDGIEPSQLAAVIATERLADDFEAVFGFRPVAERNRHYGSRGTALSPQGRANLAREFAAEYRTLDRLADLARRAGTPMSMTYDPVRGAVAV